MTTCILVRNTMSFAISYGITPWLTNLGLQNCFISAAFIGMTGEYPFLCKAVPFLEEVFLVASVNNGPD